jgi:hypothetical protein
VRGRTGGRPPALSAADKQVARTLLQDPAITMADVAKRLQVSPATLYRHLSGGRSGLNEARGSGPRVRRGLAQYSGAGRVVELDFHISLTLIDSVFQIHTSTSGTPPPF